MEPVSTKPATIDLEVISSLQELGGDDDPELFCELVDLYLTSAPKQLAEIRNAMDACDATALEAAAHSLKSASANMGAAALAAAADRVEAAGRSGEISSVRAQVNGLPEEFDQVRVELSRLSQQMFD